MNTDREDVLALDLRERESKILSASHHILSRVRYAISKGIHALLHQGKESRQFDFEEKAKITTTGKRSRRKRDNIQRVKSKADRHTDSMPAIHLHVCC